MTRSFISFFYVPRDITPTKMRGSKIPTDNIEDVLSTYQIS